MSEVDNRARVGRLGRPARLLLKRAYAKSERRPLWIEGPAMAAVAARAVAAGEARYVREDRAAVILTTRGLALATVLRVDGWPDCEKVRR